MSPNQSMWCTVLLGCGLLAMPFVLVPLFGDKLKDRHLYTVYTGTGRSYFHVHDMHNGSSQYTTFTTQEGEEVTVTGDRVIVQEQP